MKILFLTNNKITDTLYHWLCFREGNVDYLEDKFDAYQWSFYNPDLIISYNYKHIIDEEIINLGRNIINLHISYLPYNRGADPNFWSIVDGTPSGVTIHKIDKGIDTGDILLQKTVDIKDTDTLGSSYTKLHREIQKLFIDNWESIRDNKIKPTPQVGKGTYHAVKDFYKLRVGVLKRLACV